jgi:hypothetical protein
MGGRSRELPREGSAVLHWAKSGAGELKSQLPYVRQNAAEAIVVVLTKR